MVQMRVREKEAELRAHQKMVCVCKGVCVTDPLKGHGCMLFVALSVPMPIQRFLRPRVCLLVCTPASETMKRRASPRQLFHDARVLG